MRLLRAFQAYRASADPRIAAGNIIALMLAYNGPFYPLYLYFLVGRAAWPSLIALWAVPCFALVPAVARRAPMAGKMLLLGTGILNTLIYTKLLGEGAALPLFLLPCAQLAAMLFRPRERVALWTMVLLPVGLYVGLRGQYGAPLGAFTASQYQAMAVLSEVSVAALIAIFSLMAASLPGGEAPEEALNWTAALAKPRPTDDLAGENPGSPHVHRDRKHPEPRDAEIPSGP